MSISPAITGAAKELPVAVTVEPSIHATGTSTPMAPHSAGGVGFAAKTSGSPPSVAATEKTEAKSDGIVTFGSLASALTNITRRYNARSARSWNGANQSSFVVDRLRFTTCMPASIAQSMPPAKHRARPVSFSPSTRTL